MASEPYEDILNDPNATKAQVIHAVIHCSNRLRSHAISVLATKELIPADLALLRYHLGDDYNLSALETVMRSGRERTAARNAAQERASRIAAVEASKRLPFVPADEPQRRIQLEAPEAKLQPAPELKQRRRIQLLDDE